jgi:hypothetical protein
MFGSRKKPKVDFDAPLSPEADKFLEGATAEFNRKQETLCTDWRFDSYKQWGFDQISGILKLEFKDGSEFHADGQILGSYSKGDNSWEWAWNNPHVEASMKKDSQKVKEVGKRLGIEYLLHGMIPIPGETFVSYLSAIGLKATNSIGVFRGPAGPIDALILLKNPRWAKKGARSKKP